MVVFCECCSCAILHCPYAPKVAHPYVDNPVGKSLRSAHLAAYRKVRNKLHSTAQLIAHFIDNFHAQSYLHLKLQNQIIDK